MPILNQKRLHTVNPFLHPTLKLPSGAYISANISPIITVPLATFFWNSSGSGWRIHKVFGDFELYSWSYGGLIEWAVGNMYIRIFFLLTNICFPHLLLTSHPKKGQNPMKSPNNHTDVGSWCTLKLTLNGPANASLDSTWYSNPLMRRRAKKYI